MNQTTFGATLRLHNQFSPTLRTARSDLRTFRSELRTTAGAGDSFKRSQDRSSGATGRFGRAVGSASSRLQRFSTGFDRATAAAGRLTQTLRTRVRWGLYGLSFAMSGFVGMGLKFNATLQSQEQAFTTLLGSAGKARAFMKELRALSRVGPFEFGDLTSGAQKLVAFGISAEQTIKTLSALQDAISASGGDPEKIQRAVLAIGQIQAKGRVQAEELLQLTEAGIPAYRILQKELGLTREQVANIGKEGVTSAQAIPALTRGLNRLYGGASAQQAKTFSGRISTLKDDVRQLSAYVTRDLFDGLANKVLPALGRLTGGLSDIWSQDAGSFTSKLKASWGFVNDSLDQYLRTGGEQELTNAGRNFGEFLGKGVMALFGSGAGKNPFVQAGKFAFRGFWRGFRSNIDIGDISQSPLGKAIGAYFLLKWGPKLGLLLLKGMLSTRGGGLPGLGRRVGRGGKTIPGVPAGVVPVYVVNMAPSVVSRRRDPGPVVIPGSKPGRRTPRTPAPSPAQKPRRFGSWLSKVKGVPAITALTSLSYWLETGSPPDPVELFIPAEPAGGGVPPAPDRQRKQNRRALKANLGDLREQFTYGHIDRAEYRTQRRSVLARYRDANDVGTGRGPDAPPAPFFNESGYTRTSKIPGDFFRGEAALRTRAAKAGNAAGRGLTQETVKTIRRGGPKVNTAAQGLGTSFEQGLRSKYPSVSAAGAGLVNAATAGASGASPSAATNPFDALARRGLGPGQGDVGHGVMRLFPSTGGVGSTVGAPTARRPAPRVGVPRFHGGGTFRLPDVSQSVRPGTLTRGDTSGRMFRAPSRGGEGLALLRDGERVSPSSASPSQPVRSIHVAPQITIDASDGLDAHRLARQVAGIVTAELEAAVANMSLVGDEA
ncbi:MAG: tape measure protein [Thermoleophilia bacterium]